MSGKFALIFGNTDYTDPALARLTAPGRDAQDLARVLKDPAICGFDDVHVAVNEPSASAIEAIDEFFDGRKPDDLLVLYFSGHGIRDEAGSLYLAFGNTVRTRLRSTAIKAEYIREAMDESRSKRQVLVLDCCNSGAFPSGTKAELGGRMGMAAALQGYGRYVLTASDATQFAWEGDRLIGETDNSLFTHFLVKGLEGEADRDSDGAITVDDLYDYAFEQISRLTPNQTPTKSAARQEGDIILRQITRIQDIRPVSLPDELLEAIADARPYVREGAVQQLQVLLNGRNRGLARSAHDALETMCVEDDSTRVRKAASDALSLVMTPEQVQAETPRPALQETEGVRIAQTAPVPVAEKPNLVESFVKARERRAPKPKVEQPMPVTGGRMVPGWLSILWIALGMGISSLLTRNLPIDVATNVALTAGLGALAPAVVLRLEHTLTHWKSLLGIVLGWALAWAITGFYVAGLLNNGWNFGFSYRVTFTQGISGAIAGAAIALVLVTEHPTSRGPLLLWITAGWAVAGAVDALFWLLLYNGVFEPAGINIAVPLFIGSAVDGMLGGAIMIWLLRRERLRLASD